MFFILIEYSGFLFLRSTNKIRDTDQNELSHHLALATFKLIVHNSYHTLSLLYIRFNYFEVNIFETMATFAGFPRLPAELQLMILSMIQYPISNPSLDRDTILR